ncbi:MAG: hypothetical protein LQ350_003070 [Teloschistes chrysophthalmus]|nr:MAG: hypothetical protein LQ350_003070 [Niorma chrysophthalma]
MYDASPSPWTGQSAWSDQAHPLRRVTFAALDLHWQHAFFVANQVQTREGLKRFEGLSTSQEELLAPPHSRNSLSSSIFGMSSKEPDLERADGASKTPQIQLGTSSSTPKGADGTKRRASKQRPQSTNRRHSQQRPLSRLAPPHHDPNAVPPKLVKLRTVIGISTPDSLLALSSSDLKQRPGANLGIYARIIKQEQIARYEFYFAASLINTCYAGQIVVAAALTALGASSSSHVVITVLGALNTVIAGMLTYLKGQGLPNRLRQYWNSLRKCREFIEEKERQCAAEGWGEDGQEGMDIDHEIDVIIKMYHDVRQTAEDNTPDTYLPMSGNSAAVLNQHKPAGNDRKGSSVVPYPVDDKLDEQTEDEHDDVDSEDENPAPKTSPGASTSDAAKKSGPEAQPSPPAAPTPTPTQASAPTTSQAPANGAATQPATK